MRCFTHLLVSDGALEDALLRVVDEGAAGTVAAAAHLVVGPAVASLVLAVVDCPAHLLQAVGVVTPVGGAKSLAGSGWYTAGVGLYTVMHCH